MQTSITPNTIVCGDSREMLRQIAPDSVSCSIWSPPYHVGKEYEAGNSYEDWQALMREVLALHFAAIKPGGFVAINIADILCFPDPSMPRIMAANTSRHRSSVTREQVLAAKREHPDFNRYQLAALLGCSEQTIDRRLNGNNIRGGKYETQTRVKLAGSVIEQAGLDAGFYLYDRRVWKKDAAWENSRWHTMSYRAVDEFEDIYILWKPGITTINRNRLTKAEWVTWGSRAVWDIPSVRANDNHEAKFPLELPRRLIQLLTEPDDIVLDCFIGSGTTAVAAILMGRRYIGIDNQQKYVAMAKAACARTTEDLFAKVTEEPAFRVSKMYRASG